MRSRRLGTKLQEKIHQGLKPFLWEAGFGTTESRALSQDSARSIVGKPVLLSAYPMKRGQRSVGRVGKKQTRALWLRFPSRKPSSNFRNLRLVEWDCGVRDQRQEDQREEGCAESGKEVHGVVVEESAPFEGCAEQAVEEKSEDAAEAADCEHQGSAAQGKGACGGDEHGRRHAGESATDADGAVGSCGSCSESCNHAWTAAQHLAEFRGNRIGGRLAQGGEAGDEDGGGSETSKTEPPLIELPALRWLAGKERRHAKICGDLYGLASLVAFRSAELLLAPATETGGKRSENQDGQDGNQTGAPGKVGNGRGGKHQTGGDGCACKCGAGGRGSNGEGDQTENRTQAEAPDGNRQILLRPPVRLKDNVYGDGREHEQQDQLGLPGEFGWFHPSS